MDARLHLRRTTGYYYFMDLGGLRDSFLSFLNEVPVIRAIVGGIIVLFLPGFAWTLALFKTLKNIERIALSIGISIAGVTVCVLAANLLFKVNITGTNALIIIAVITVIPLIIYIIKRSMRKPEIEEVEAEEKEE